MLRLLPLLTLLILPACGPVGPTSEPESFRAAPGGSCPPNARQVDAGLCQCEQGADLFPDGGWACSGVGL